jgi:hypothetical protein
MPTSMPTRFRAATDSHPVLTPPCLQSAPHASRHPSSRAIMFGTASPTQTALADFGCAAVRSTVSVLRRIYPIPIHPPR